MNRFLPLLAGTVRLACAAFLLWRFAARKGLHLRAWYLCGAFLSAAWLGQGTLSLLARGRWWVHAFAGVR